MKFGKYGEIQQTETPKVVWKLSVGWFCEDLQLHGADGKWEQTFSSEEEAEEMLDGFIKENPRCEIWWTLYKIETLAVGHLNKRYFN